MTRDTLPSAQRIASGLPGVPKVLHILGLANHLKDYVRIKTNAKVAIGPVKKRASDRPIRAMDGLPGFDWSCLVASRGEMKHEGLYVMFELFYTK